MARQAFVGERTWKNEVRRERDACLILACLKSSFTLPFKRQVIKSSFLGDDTDLPAWQRKEKVGGGGVKESENGMTALPGDLVHFIFPFLSTRNACRLQTSAV